MSTHVLLAAILVTVVLLLEVAHAQSGDDSDVIQVGRYDDPSPPKTHKECRLYSEAKCEYKEKKYSLLDTWLTDECHECTCYNDAVICCDVLQLPIEWPSRCTPKIDKLHCRVDIVQIHKPWRLCGTRRSKKVRKHNRKNALMSYRDKSVMVMSGPF